MNRLAATVRALVAVATVLTVVLMVWFMRRAGSNTARADFDRSVAVLPFAAGDTASTYLAEGIADDVANTLSQVPELTLAARRSSEHVARTHATVEEIGTALNVNTVLEGTVERVGERVRVSATLTNARDGVVLWQQKYDRDARVLTTVPTDIAGAIATQLQVPATSSDRAQLASRGARDAVAYDLYLKGAYGLRHGAHKGTAIANLEQSVQRDSSFARAWAALSTALLESTHDSAVAVRDVMPRARAAAMHAMTLDSQHVDVQMALGIVHAEAHEWAEAESRLRRATAIGPNSGHAHRLIGRFYSWIGRAEEAVVALQRAKAIDPLSSMTAAALGSAQVSVGQVDVGIAELKRALELQPDHPFAIEALSMAYVVRRAPDSAVTMAHRVLTRAASPVRSGGAAFVLGRSDKRAEAEAIMRRLNRLPADTPGRWTALFLAYRGLGDDARAADAFARAADSGEPFPVFASTVFSGLRVTPKVTLAFARYRLDPARFVAPR